jgi:hypothetical protein
MPAIQTLEVTKSRLIKIWWAFLWRFSLSVLAAVICSFIIGAVIGGVLGTVIHFSGYDIANFSAQLEMTGYVIGILVYLAFTIIPVYYLLNKKFGDFSLILVKNEDIEKLTRPEMTKTETVNRNFSAVDKPAY